MLFLKCIIVSILNGLIIMDFKAANILSSNPGSDGKIIIRFNG